MQYDEVTSKSSYVNFQRAKILACHKHIFLKKKDFHLARTITQTKN